MDVYSLVVIVVVELVKSKTSVAINVPIRIAANTQHSRHRSRQSRLQTGRFLQNEKRGVRRVKHELTFFSSVALSVDEREECVHAHLLWSSPSN